MRVQPRTGLGDPLFTTSPVHVRGDRTRVTAGEQQHNEEELARHGEQDSTAVGLFQGAVGDKLDHCIQREA
jgi:hypothetical protein